MREIKFRAWDKKSKQFSHITARGGAFLYNNLILGGDIKEMELMQFTGLKDKNGKEIYEGDVVEWKPTVLDRKMRGKVIWHEQSGAWFVLDDLGVYNHLGLLLNIKTEIIGNIYENPELIK